MPPPPPRPDERLLAWARERISAKSVRCDWAGHAHAESRVWRLALASGRVAYLKQHLRAGKFRQELRAYRAWQSALAHETPELLAARDAAPRALLLASAPGLLAAKLAPLDVAEEARLYEAAGRFSRKLHGLPHADTDVLPLREAIRQRADRILREGTRHVDAVTLERVGRRFRRALIDLLDAPRRVPCHRDYTPRNWLWDGARLTVIDFEHARPDYYLHDVARLYGEHWHVDARRAEAFWRGYRRAPTRAEGAYLRAYAALQAVSTVEWAVRHGDRAFEATGRDVLRVFAQAEPG